jgi:hypothetical protein
VNNFCQTGAMKPTPSWPYDEMIRAWWVQPGQLLAGEYPGATGDARARAAHEPVPESPAQHDVFRRRAARGAERTTG